MLFLSTWSATPFTGFYQVPITREAADKTKDDKDAWHNIMSCGDATSPGYVYAENGDISHMPFYNGG